MILHPIPPVFDRNSTVLILGSFPSRRSREEGFFYGHDGSSDASIRNVSLNDLGIILDRADIREIFVNGKTAYGYYQRYSQPLTGRPAVCLPSTSPANAAWDLDRLVKAWRCIAKTARAQVPV